MKINQKLVKSKKINKNQRKSSNTISLKSKKIYENRMNNAYQRRSIKIHDNENESLLKPMGIYGIEASQVSGPKQKSLTTAIKDGISRKCNQQRHEHHAHYVKQWKRCGPGGRHSHGQNSHLKTDVCQKTAHRPTKTLQCILRTATSGQTLRHWIKDNRLVHHRR